ncbi:MAG: hypothetical protein ABSA49_05870, partial [Rhizomicrobium sp.]
EDEAQLAAQACLIEAYERSRWPRRRHGPAEVLTYQMEQHSLSRADLVPLLGTPSRVSEVLSGKRELSMTMVQRLRERFDISADALIPSAPRAQSDRSLISNEGRTITRYSGINAPAPMDRGRPRPLGI